MKRIIFLAMCIVLVSSVVALTDSEDTFPSPFEDPLTLNEDIVLSPGDSLTSDDLLGYSGTATLPAGSSATMPSQFEGTLVLTGATVTMPDGRSVTGTGTCDKNGCTMIGGESGEGDSKVSDGSFRVDYDGTVSILGEATIGEGDSAIRVSEIESVTFNDDGTITFVAQPGAEIGGIVTGTAGEIVYQPSDNSLALSTNEDVFIIDSYVRSKDPITIVHTGTDVQLEKGMFLSDGSTMVVPDNQNLPPNYQGSYIAFDREKLLMHGEDFSIRFDGENEILNILPQSVLQDNYDTIVQDFMDSYGLDESMIDIETMELAKGAYSDVEEMGIDMVQFMAERKSLETLLSEKDEPIHYEVSMEGGDLGILSRKVVDPGQLGGVDVYSSLAPQIISENTEGIVAEITNGDMVFSIGAEGIIESRLHRGRHAMRAIPSEYIIQSNGESVITSKEGVGAKVYISANEQVEFNSLEVDYDMYGQMRVGEELCQNIMECEKQNVRFSNQMGDGFVHAMALDAAMDEYTDTLGTHTFTPEYDQDLSHVSLMYTESAGPNLFKTQIALLEELPEYAEVTMFVQKPEDIEKIQSTVPPEILERMTFEYSEGIDNLPWAQDYTEGDGSVQILPLTRDGSPYKPNNEFVYGLEDQGVDVRRAPVDFEGGNVFVVRNKAGEDVVLVGSNSLDRTQRAYEIADREISEDQYREYMGNTFGADEVVILGEKSGDHYVPQPGTMFHIDQAMVPLGDGVVAMPEVDLPPAPQYAASDLVKQRDAEIEALAGENYDPSDEKRIYAKYDEQIDAAVQYEKALKTAETVDSYKQQMESQGFDVVSLQTEAGAVEKFQSYTNGLVYKDKNTGERTVIMPIFPNEAGEYSMTGLNAKNKAAYEAAGFTVKTVEDHSFEMQGNIHCLSLLAGDPQNCPDCALGQ